MCFIHRAMVVVVGEVVVSVLVDTTVCSLGVELADLQLMSW